MKNHKPLSYFLIYSLAVHTVVVISLLLCPKNRPIVLSAPSLSMTTVKLQKTLKKAPKQKHTLAKRRKPQKQVRKKTKNNKKTKPVAKKSKSKSSSKIKKNQTKKSVRSNRAALAKLTAQLQGLEKSIQSHSHRIQYKVPTDNKKVEEYYELVGALLKKHIYLANKEPIHIKIKIGYDGKVQSCHTRDNTYYKEVIAKIEEISFPPTREWFERKGSVEITLVLEPL